MENTIALGAAIIGSRIKQTRHDATKDGFANEYEARKMLCGKRFYSLKNVKDKGCTEEKKRIGTKLKRGFCCSIDPSQQGFLNLYQMASQKKSDEVNAIDFSNLFSSSDKTSMDVDD
tara:strand:+ start:560 stop:910 length:351 start_codon:yes stop_codon:yes gene_type:complete